MTEQTRPPGKTTVATDVLIDIVRLATLSVPGTQALAAVPSGVDRLFTTGGAEGVQISITDDSVSTSVYVILKSKFEVLPVCHAIQSKVSRSISEMVGMEVGNVDVHVEDIECNSKKNE